MASLGHDVVGIDVDVAKIAALGRGEGPFFEPGLSELLGAALESGRLRFSTDFEDACGARVHFLAIGASDGATGTSDLSYLYTAVAELFPLLRPGDVVVGKSPAPAGIAARLAATIESTGASLAWNPELLRQGFAIADALRPERLVYGVQHGDEHSVAVLDQVYAERLTAGVPRTVIGFETAELTMTASTLLPARPRLENL
ncbi:MAG: UDP-glucose 6-dehydrogenase [Microbacteriaceae bacterium]|nr:UDP-glucose 6-dehydrogenase [Microbacteriaceae bacterium]